MKFGFAEASLEHDTGPRHPESVDRIHAIRRRLEETHGSRFVTPEAANVDQLVPPHEEAYVREIEALCERGGGSIDTDTVVSEGSWEAALASVGLALWAARQATPDCARRDLPFALCRPPGHHALADTAMGFCLFNNAAVAAHTLVATGTAEKVGILDWDVHHGNGTNDIFLERDDVVFASIHEADLYPGTGELSETGTGPGEGATLNVPLPPGANDAAYLATFREVVVPWFERHAPDRVLVSAGFDAHRHDPISRMAVSTEGYGLLTHRVLQLADDLGAGVGFFLEGGYGLDTLSESVVMVNDVCHGYEPVAETGEEIRSEDRSQIAAAREHHGLGS